MSICRSKLLYLTLGTIGICALLLGMLVMPVGTADDMGEETAILSGAVTDSEEMERQVSGSTTHASGTEYDTDVQVNETLTAAPMLHHLVEITDVDIEYDGDELVIDDRVLVHVTVRNNNDGGSGANVALYFGDEMVEPEEPIETGHMHPGEEVTVTFEFRWDHRIHGGPGTIPVEAQLWQDGRPSPNDEYQTAVEVHHFLQIDSFDGPEQIELDDGEQTFTAEIQNIGQHLLTWIETRFERESGGANFDTIETEPIDTLESGEVETVEFTWEPTSDHEGDQRFWLQLYHHDEFVTNELHEVTVGDQSDFELVDVDWPEYGYAGESQTIDVTIENTGEGSGDRTVELHYAEGVDHLDVHLNASEEQTISLDFEPVDDPHDETVTVGIIGEEDEIETEVIERTYPYFEFTDVEWPDDLYPQQTATVEATLENPHPLDAEQQVDFAVIEAGGSTQLLDTERIAIDAGEDESITFEWEPALGHQDDSFDLHLDVYSDTENTRTDVLQPGFEVDDVSAPDEAYIGHTTEITALINNTGSVGGQVDLRLAINGDTEELTPIEIDGESEETVTFEWELEDSQYVGANEIVVETFDSENNTIVEGVFPEVDLVDVTGPEEALVDDTIEIVATLENPTGATVEEQLLLRADDPDGPRLASDLSVEVDPGEEKDVTIEWEPDRDDVGVTNLYVEAASGQDEFHRIELFERESEVTDLEVLGDPMANDTVEVEATIENSLDLAVEEYLGLFVDGTSLEDYPVSVSLGPGEEKTVTLEWNSTHDDAGTHTLEAITDEQTFGDGAQTSVHLDLLFIAITGYDFPLESERTEEVTYEIDLANQGNTAGERTLVVELDGTEIGATDVSLDAGESTTETIEWVPEREHVGEGQQLTFDTGDDQDWDYVTITKGPLFEVNQIDVVDDDIDVEETLEVIAGIENVGVEPGQQNVSLVVGDDVVDSVFMEIDTDTVETERLEWDPDRADVGSNTVTVETEDHEDDVTVSVSGEENYVDVSILDLDETVDPGTSMDVPVELENLGDYEESQDIELAVDGDDLQDSITVSLDPRESSTETLSWSVPADASGNHSITVSSEDDSDTDTVYVNEPATIDVELHDSAATVTGGEPLDIDLTVTNLGEATAPRSIELEFDGETVAEQSVSPAPNSPEHVTIEWETEPTDADSDARPLIASSPDDSDAMNVTVLQPPTLSVTHVDVASDLAPGENETAAVTVENVGDVAGVQTVSVEIDDVELTSEPVELEPGANTTVELEFTVPPMDGGAYTLGGSTLDDEQSIDVSVISPPTTTLDAFDAPDVITAGDVLSISATVTNVDDWEGIVPVMLLDDGESLAQADVTMAVDETDTVTLEWQTDGADVGSHDLQLDTTTDDISVPVVVEERDDDDSGAVVAGGGGGGQQAAPGGAGGRLPVDDGPDDEDPSIDIQRSTHVSGEERISTTVTTIPAIFADRMVRIEDADRSLIATNVFSLDTLEITPSIDGSAAIAAGILEPDPETETLGETEWPLLETEHEDVTAVTYFELDHDLGDNVSDATISTSVLSENITDPTNTSIYHYSDDGWYPLDTAYEQSASDEYQFVATTEDFSAFAVGTPKAAVDDPVEDPEPADDPIIVEPEDFEESLPLLAIFILGLLITLVSLSVVAFYDARFDIE